MLQQEPMNAPLQPIAMTGPTKSPNKPISEDRIPIEHPHTNPTEQASA